jgi:alkanesulfonate monooxygenase SsuD/methylene tetrahydromethanopterin reductase-like flavin-dependent oxidoreductase (luciferase family)
VELGYFSMPAHPPERGLKAGHDADLAIFRLLDTLDFQEIWVGEHHTVRWEPHPAPDLLIAQALLQTSRIRLGPGGFLLPYHHPAELANRVAMLDHLSGGRLNFGVAASAIATDLAMFNMDGASGENRAATREALDIILRLWSEDEPFHFEGRFWKVDRPAPRLGGLLAPHLKPLQKPHPPIGIAGMSKGSDTLKLAGERGFLPLSVNIHADHVKEHWSAVEAGAARTGRTPSRRDWRLIRDIFVAETDEEAWRLSVGGMMGRMMREYWLAIFRHYGFMDYLKHAPDVADSDVTAEYCARHDWIVGSPATVAARIEELYDTVGGFGTLLVIGYDYLDQPGVWENSLRLLSSDVLPRIRHLRPA